MANYWVWPVTKENWIVAEKMGIWAYKTRYPMDKVRDSDEIIFYIVKAGEFAGVYRVVGDWYENNTIVWEDEKRKGMKIYRYEVKIEKIATGRIKAKDLKDRLIFLKDRYPLALKGSAIGPANNGKPIPKEDYEVILEMMNEVNREARTRKVEREPLWIEDYVRRSMEQIERYIKERWTEDNTKAILIEPLLRELGWNIYSLDEVERGYSIRIGTKSVEVDYALKIEGVVKMFLEAKALNEDLGKFIEQAISYARVGGVSLVVLTNGRELKVFNAQGKTQLFELHLEKYGEERDKLLLLSREKVKEGVIERMCEEELHRIAIKEWLYRFSDKIMKEVMLSNPNLKEHLVKKLIMEMLDKI